MKVEPKSVPVTEPEEETYEQLAAKLNARKEKKLADLFDNRMASQAITDEVDKEILKVVGDPQERDRQMLLIAARKAGPKGIVLGDLRSVIPDPNDLSNARKALREPKDENGKPLPPLIREERVKLEIIVYAVDATASIPAEVTE
jgi:hypothetical protein